jgi:arsenate reductase
LIQDKGIEPNVIEYLQCPPNVEELHRIIALLGVSPRNIIRKNEEDYQTSGAKDLSLNDDQLIKLMVKFPKLIERPIVLANGKAIIGRPPENVLTII